MKLKIDAKFEEKLICCFKTDKNLVNFDPSTQIYILIGPLHKKYVIFDPKKYRGAIFHDTREWYKIWGKIDLWFGK